MSNITKSQQQRLRACERVLQEHLEEFAKVGLALAEIRDDKLYKVDGFKTFEDYIKKWEFGRAWAFRLMAAAELRMSIPSVEKSPTGDMESGWKEAHVRELHRLGSTSKARSVAARVIKEAELEEKPITASFVRKHVDKALGIKRSNKPIEHEPEEFRNAISRWINQLNGISDGIDSVDDNALAAFGKNNPDRADRLASAIDRLSSCLDRVWAQLP